MSGIFTCRHPGCDVAIGLRNRSLTCANHRHGLYCLCRDCRLKRQFTAPVTPAPRVAERADVRVLRLAQVSSTSGNIQFEAISMPRAPWE